MLLLEGDARDREVLAGALGLARPGIRFAHAGESADFDRLAVVTLDVRGRVRTWNAAAERLFGWRADEVVGRPSPIIPAEGFDEYLREMGERLGGGPREAVVRRRRKDGGWVELLRLGAPIRDAGGEVVGALGMFVDVGDRPGIEAAEREARARTEFMSRMSHDLRTPLNAILGFAQLLDLDELPGEQGDAVRQILAAGGDLVSIVDGLIDSRPEDGRWGGPSPASGEPGSSGEAPAGEPRPMLVLHIEDNASNRTLMEQILEGLEGIELRSAGLGRAGIDIARRERPGLVLLDLHLPDMEGEEVLRRLRGEPATQDTPIVVVSADATAHHIEQLKAAGATDYLTKPFDVRAFQELVLGMARAARRRASEPGGSPA